MSFGIADPQHYIQLRDRLRDFPTCLSFAMIRTGCFLYNTCRSKGIQGSHIDFLICAVAIAPNCFHSQWIRIFRLRQILPIKSFRSDSSVKLRIKRDLRRREIQFSHIASRLGGAVLASMRLLPIQRLMAGVADVVQATMISSKFTNVSRSTTTPRTGPIGRRTTKFIRTFQGSHLHST